MANRRSLTIHFEDVDDDQYTDLAAAVWIVVGGLQRARRFKAEMVVDDPDRRRDVDKRIAERADDLKYAER